ncbi:MAG: hypothetical protein PSU93_09320 [Methylobacter sp.]|uniref:Uncharacterized protein n=1 Tax=Candidatus Methylobacter titanis TaxID=3053457 RepID=A0AA43Q486_9GAMM|nr:hypothetical protein [Candidatus Methylobacter titanis]
MTTLRKLIEQRIAAQTTLFKEVAGAASINNIMTGRLSDAGCYVFQEARKASESKLVGLTRQRVSLSFAFIIAVRNVKDARGGDAADACALLQAAVQAALLGWEPDSATEPFEYAGGNLISFTNGFFIWKDSYRTAQLIQST